MPNLYLVGFMGTGKSAVGRLVAERLGMRFIDSDDCIEREAGMDIPAIFEAEGEAGFRAREKRFVEAGHPDCGCVVSTGGGMVAQPGMGEALRARGVVICLFANARTVYERTRGNPNRPLLRGDDPQGRIRELLAEREPHYKRAGTGVSTDHRSLADVARHVERVYLKHARHRSGVGGKE